MKLNKIALVLALFGLSSTYAFAQQANEDTQQEKVERISTTVEKNHKLNAYSSSSLTMSNLSEVL